MANEATVRVSMEIRKGHLHYRNDPTTFQADVAAVGGPSPGTILVSVAGTDVDFGELTDPGLCFVRNLDPDNFVTYGVWDPEFARFYPVHEILPGESYPVRWSRSLFEEYGTGTGTLGADTNRPRFKADIAACLVTIEAFNR